MSPELISLLVQFPLVAAFAFFTFNLLKAFNSSQKELQAATQAHEAELQAQTLAYLDEQNARWREILNIERERRKEAMDQGLHEVDSLVKSLDKLAVALVSQTEQIQRHDAAAITRHEELIRQIQSDAR